MTELNPKKLSGKEYMRVDKAEWVCRDDLEVDGARYYSTKTEAMSTSDVDDLIIEVKYRVLGCVGQALRPANLSKVEDDDDD